MLPIEKRFVKYNYTTAPGRKIEYVVIHDTANSGHGADANAHFNYFNGGDRNASADFFVDDSRIVQIIDYKNCYSWQVGDGGGAYGITNRNAVGIEVCINSDGNYEKAFANAIELAVHLLKELGLPLSRLVRHYDASRKSCPGTMKANNWEKWNEFVRRATELYNGGKPVTPTPPQPSGKKQLHLPASAKTWNVYNVNGPYTVGNEVGKLAPANYGGLTYDILGNPVTHVYIIQTSSFGRVAIYAGPDTSAKITGSSTSTPSKPSTPSNGGEVFERSYPENGKATVVCSSLNVRSTHYATGNTPVASYSRGEYFFYDSVYLTNKYVYCSYVSNSGARRYVAVKDRQTGERFANCV